MSETEQQNYAGVFDTELEFGRSPALILIDFVHAYFDKDNPLYANVEQALSSGVRVRTAARDAGVPVIYTNVEYHPTMIDAGRFFEKVMPLSAFKAGSKSGAFMPSLTPNSEELVVTKQYPSAFFGTSLSSTLTAMGIDSVFLTGLSTSGCVRATCVDACSYGFTTFVIPDACGDRHTGPHEANLFDMGAKYASLIREENAIDYFKGLKQHD